MATTASSRERGAQARSRLAFSLLPFLRLPSSGRIWRTEKSKTATRCTSQLGTSRVGTRLAARPTAFENPGHLADRHEIAGSCKKALALRRRISHGANVQIGDIAHIDGTETQPRTAGHGTVH